MGVDGGTWDGLLWTWFFSRLTKDHIQVSTCHLTANLSFDNLWMVILRAYVEVPLLGFICSNHSFWSLTEHEQTCGKGWGNCKTESAESSEGCKWPMSYM